MLTLRQIEVIRAIMVAGTVGGAARLLNVSAPGVSRIMKHAEGALGLKLFNRKSGRFEPAAEAQDIFSLINGVYDKVEDLQFVVGRLKRGVDAELRVGAVPSISNVMVPRAIADVHRRFPELTIDVDVLKLEEAIGYLLLRKGEAVAMSHRLEHPMLTFAPLAEGRLKCIVPKAHPLASRTQVSVRDIVTHKLIGIDPGDPFGRALAAPITGAGLPYDLSIKARFGSTVCALVTNGLGIAIIDEFTLAGGNWPSLAVLDIVEPATLQTYVAQRRDVTLSTYCMTFITALRSHMTGMADGRRGTARAGRQAKKVDARMPENLT